MPQLDLVSFLPQLFWFVIIILSLYFQLGKNYLPSINKTLLLREYIYNTINLSLSDTDKPRLSPFQENTFGHLIMAQMALKETRKQSIKSDLIEPLCFKLARYYRIGRPIGRAYGPDFDRFEYDLLSSYGNYGFMSFKADTRLMRQYQVEQDTWRDSWFGNFFAKSNGGVMDSRTKTLAVMGNASSLRLIKLVLNITSKFSIGTKSNDLLTRYYTLLMLNEIKNKNNKKKQKNKDKKKSNI
jgi:hypothetical protein